MKNLIVNSFLVSVFISVMSCSKDDSVDIITVVPNPTPVPVVLPTSVLPLSDQNNSGNWVLNSEVSDEFDALVLDENKWLVQGRNGVFESNHKGRAPSQCSLNNFRLEDGKLKL